MLVFGLYEFQLFQAILGNVFQKFCVPRNLNQHTCSQWPYMCGLIAYNKNGYDCSEVYLTEVLTDTPSLLCYSYTAASYTPNNRSNVGQM